MNLTKTINDGRVAREELDKIFNEAGDAHDLAAVKSLTGTETERMNHVKDLNARVERGNLASLVLTAGPEHFESTGSKARPVTRKGTVTAASEWGTKAATRVQAVMGTKALTSASVDIEQLLFSGVSVNPFRTDRLVNQINNVKTVEGSNTFEYIEETVRTHAAAPVADGSPKPVSTYTVTPRPGKLEVIAHLSEGIPQRILEDHTYLSKYLENVMVEGLLDAYEYQIFNGNGTSPNFRGITNTPGIGGQAYSNSVPETLRKALTKQAKLHETPNLFVINPDTAETLDLTTTDDGLYIFADSSQENQILGGRDVLVSTSAPAGKAYLVDTNQLMLVQSGGLRVDVDISGDNFRKNLATMRVEARLAYALLRPQSFVEINVTSS